ncbi:PAQR family membrane homeostasis protein TrhA [Pareuzebyella sediminis]|uniref:PAQR family membrane homeostasis protein TrhA n=1 Tax=Pareuzebyella sediminis TaxID=2607998 RepID=UPI003742FC56
MGSKRIRPGEERLNALSHLLGSVLAVVGLFVLLNQQEHTKPYSTFAFVIYGVSLIAMFSVSAMYHWVADPRLKRLLRIADHINIYFLIAGTYTPVALIALGGENGWRLFYQIWAIAAFGTLFKLFYTGRFEYISLLLYIGMGWLIVFDYRQLAEASTTLGIVLLMGGGAFYTLGIIFYAWERIPYHHFIWHLFVLAGAICHWFFVYLGF